MQITNLYSFYTNMKTIQAIIELYKQGLFPDGIPLVTMLPIFRAKRGHYYNLTDKDRRNYKRMFAELRRMHTMKIGVIALYEIAKLENQSPYWKWSALQKILTSTYK